MSTHVIPNMPSHTTFDLRNALLLVAAFSISACDQPQPAGGVGTTDPCVFDTVRFNRDFPGARLNHCEQIGNQHYLLSIEPAFRPVNPSAWYAFQVQVEDVATIDITLNASDGFARYQPKISSDMRNWQPITYTADNATMQFTLNMDETAPSGNQLYVAAQPLIVETDYQQWLASHNVNPWANTLTLGASAQQRPIHALEVAQPGNPWLLLIGRQHPPEVTGAQAFFYFADRLLANEPLAIQFRSRFNILMVPNMNPDGVAQGHWRHNNNGIDLNRDWHDFSQPETLAVLTALNQRLQKPEDLVFALDFHSTNRNVFYSMPVEKGLSNPELTKRWLGNTASRLPDYVLEEVAGDFPENGVFKQFIADYYGTHAVTYEVGDNTTQEEISDTAVIGAEEMMRLLLDLQGLHN